MNDEGTGDSQTLDCGGLQPGESVSRTLTFNLPAGDYDMNVVVNARGPLFLGNVIVADCE